MPGLLLVRGPVRIVRPARKRCIPQVRSPRGSTAGGAPRGLGAGIGTRGKRYLKRQPAAGFGEPALRYLTENRASPAAQWLGGKWSLARVLQRAHRPEVYGGDGGRLKEESQPYLRGGFRNVHGFQEPVP